MSRDNYAISNHSLTRREYQHDHSTNLQISSLLPRHTRSTSSQIKVRASSSELRLFTIVTKH
jgi:hypothetical protein